MKAVMAPWMYPLSAYATYKTLVFVAGDVEIRHEEMQSRYNLSP